LEHQCRDGGGVTIAAKFGRDGDALHPGTDLDGGIKCQMVGLVATRILGSAMGWNRVSHTYLNTEALGSWSKVRNWSLPSGVVRSDQLRIVAGVATWCMVPGTPGSHCNVEAPRRGVVVDDLVDDSTGCRQVSPVCAKTVGLMAMMAHLSEPEARTDQARVSLKPTRQRHRCTIGVGVSAIDPQVCPWRKGLLPFDPWTT